MEICFVQDDRKVKKQKNIKSNGLSLVLTFNGENVKYLKCTFDSTRKKVLSVSLIIIRVKIHFWSKDGKEESDTVHWWEDSAELRAFFFYPFSSKLSCNF